MPDYTGELRDLGDGWLVGAIRDPLGVVLQLDCEWDEARRAWRVRGTVVLPPWLKIEGLDQA